jgi:hypothetical protein
MNILIAWGCGLEVGFAHMDGVAYQQGIKN